MGMIRREVDPDLFAAVVHHIVGQQISTKAQATVWRRMQEALGPWTPGAYWRRDRRACRRWAQRAQGGLHHGLCPPGSERSLRPETVRESSDAEAIRQLCTLKGVGVWTAEMILLFCLQRPDIFSYDDLAIQRGRGWCITTGRWAGSCLRSIGGGTAPTAAWPVSICGRWPGGAVPELRDYGPQGKKGAK